MSKEFKRVHKGDSVENLKEKYSLIHTKESAAAVNKLREEVVLGKRKSMEEILALKASHFSGGKGKKVVGISIGKLRKLYMSTYPEKDKPTYPEKELPDILRQ